MVINLSGPEGNAFALMAIAKQLGKQIGIPGIQIEDIIEDMTAGNYNNLLDVFEEHFGSVVEFENDPRSECSE